MSNLEEVYLPLGRFVHVPPSFPCSDYAFPATPWWEDYSLLAGRLSARSRRVRVVNMLTRDEHFLEVCVEETLSSILGKYLSFNAHASSYTWKRLGGKGEDKMVPLNMALNLEQNGVKDDSADFEALRISEDFYVPSIHLYFNDDLSVA